MTGIVRWSKEKMRRGLKYTAFLLCVGVQVAVRAHAPARWKLRGERIMLEVVVAHQALHVLDSGNNGEFCACVSDVEYPPYAPACPCALTY